MSVNSYALKKLRDIRREYEPDAPEYVALTRLIELEKFRLKYGTAAYLALTYGGKQDDYEDLVNQAGLDI